MARDEQSRIYYDSLHAAGFFLARSKRVHMYNWHSRVKDPCHDSCTTAKLRFTMQHADGPSGNLGNECADHAAALGTLGFISSHNVTTRWIHHNFDADACLDGFHNIMEILEQLQRIRTDAVSLSQHRI